MHNSSDFNWILAVAVCGDTNYIKNVSFADSCLPRLMFWQLKSDSDKGDLSIKYVLSGEGAEEVFHIDENTGKISTLRKLDREEKAFYVLRGQALDRRSNQPVEPESEFIIHVQDTNDNMPNFINEPYVSSIPEMCPVGKLHYTFCKFERAL